MKPINQACGMNLCVPAQTSSYREYVTSGLDSNIGNFRIVVKRFNSTHTLKLICCETSCPAGPSTLPSTSANGYQLLLFNVKNDTSDSYDLLSQGAEEAAELVQQMPTALRSECSSSLDGYMAMFSVSPSEDAVVAEDWWSLGGWRQKMTVVGRMVLQLFGNAESPGPGH